jgi:hypothetical protein
MTMGRVSFGGITKSVCLACVPEAEVGDYVVVHVGFAIAVVDEAEAGAHPRVPARAGRAGRTSKLPNPGEGGHAMKYVDEYRNEADAKKLLGAIRARVTRPWTLMEICGGQTHTFVKFGIDRMLPPEISLVHGPGCPVCVTPLEMIDKGHEIARRPDVIFTSFGDMLRVPAATPTSSPPRPPAPTSASSTRRWTP